MLEHGGNIKQVVKDGQRQVSSVSSNDISVGACMKIRPANWKQKAGPFYTATWISSTSRLVPGPPRRVLSRILPRLWKPKTERGVAKPRSDFSGHSALTLNANCGSFVQPWTLFCSVTSRSRLTIHLAFRRSASLASSFTAEPVTPLLPFCLPRILDQSSTWVFLSQSALHCLAHPSLQAGEVKHHKFTHTFSPSNRPNLDHRTSEQRTVPIPYRRGVVGSLNSNTMVSPKPESYHGALYRLAAAAESSPSPQPAHYPDSQHYPQYQHGHHPHHDPSQHHHPQSRHYVNMPPHHRTPQSHDQYRYADLGYSPASAAASSTSSAPHHSEPSASRPPLPSTRSAPDFPNDRMDESARAKLRPPEGSASSATPAAADAAAAAADAAAAAAAAAAEKKISCMECRLSKVKCSGGDLCTRCKRLGKECYYKSHKRGRKSDSSKIQKLERTVDSLSRALEQFSKAKVARSPGSAQSLPTTGLADTRRGVRSQPMDDQETSSPDSFWKTVDAHRPPAAPLSTAMSPPAHSPRANLTASQREASASGSKRPSDLHRQRSASSSWQTSHSIATATPTSDDPDEPENLGLPTLSNPLKLLAHASDSAREGLEVSDPTSSDTATKTTDNKGASASDHPSRSRGRSAAYVNGVASSADQDSSSAALRADSADGRTSLFGEYHGLTKTNTVSRFGPGRGKAFFDVGLFTTKLDNLPQFDPIDRGYLTLVEAESLYAVYMDRINPTITLLDPHLHTFDYVRSCSSLLLSCTCWIAAKYKVEASQIAADLEMHIRTNLLPTILMEGYRNAEIPQALIILAAYHPQMNTISEDKAWAYLGFAIRIASELDMNSRIAVRPPNRQDDAGLARRLRNRERTWLNLWLFETSMSQHMGRRPTLANDPVVMGCAHWHLDKFALPSDKAVVAVVQLRMLMKRNTELFENFVDASNSHLSAERTAKQVELFRRICASDLDTWLATWTGPSHQQSEQNVPPSMTSMQEVAEAGSHNSATKPSNANGGESGPDSSESLPPTLGRINRLKLYYWYARLILDTIALKCNHLGLEVLRPIYRDAYACCMAYLGLFVATMVPNGLFWGHNSAVVTPAYCAIFALKIVGLISTNATGATTLQSSGGNQLLLQRQDKAKEEEIGIDVDAEYTFEMVEKLAKACEDAGNATPHRRAAAGSYAFFLFTVLAKAKSAWNAKLARKDGEAEHLTAAKGRKRDRDANNEAGGRQSKAARNGKVGSKGHEQRGDHNGVLGSGQGAMQGHGASNKADVGGNRLAEEGVSSAAPSAEGDDLATSSGGGANADSDQHFLRQLMQFQAGPSGVQTAIVQDASLGPHPHQPTFHGSWQHQYSQYGGFAPNHPSSGMAPMPLDANMSTVAASNAASAAFAASSMGGMGDGAGANGIEGTAAAAAAGGMVDIDWDFGMLDGFLGESLFSDMSFVSASATPANMNAAHGV